MEVPMTRSNYMLALLAATVPAAASALPDRWSSGFNQGIMEYSVGDFGPRADNLILSCKGSDLDLSISIDGVRPAPHSIVTLAVDNRREELRVGKDGWARIKRSDLSPQIRRLWAGLRAGTTVKASYATGESVILPLKGSGSTLSTTPCAP
jgi:hypothetical protein